jgi:pimeloyl-ACP methyl ester carboxylesterase
MAPVSDLEYAAAANMGGGAVQDLMGGGPNDVPHHYAEADLLAKLPGRVPVTILQGTDDKQVTVKMNRQVAADHPTVSYVELEGVEHFALSPAFRDHVLPALTPQPTCQRAASVTLSSRD